MKNLYKWWITKKLHKAEQKLAEFESKANYYEKHLIPNSPTKYCHILDGYRMQVGTWVGKAAIYRERAAQLKQTLNQLG